MAATPTRREEIVTTYLNSTPLASMPGYGEIIGMPEALWVWFGTDHEEATKVLNSTPRNPAEMRAQRARLPAGAKPAPVRAAAELLPVCRTARRSRS